jgi:hypothetical protein
MAIDTNVAAQVICSLSVGRLGNFRDVLNGPGTLRADSED